MANADMFLKIDGIEGESLDADHKKEIEILSWSWGETNTGSFGHGTGGGAGKVNMQDFHFVMTMNKATPVLMKFCANGKHIPKVVLTCRRAGEKALPYLTITFQECLISSYQTGASGGMSGLPTDQISFNYTKIETKYQPQSATGSKEGGEILFMHDVKTNTTS